MGNAVWIKKTTHKGVLNSDLSSQCKSLGLSYSNIKMALIVEIVKIWRMKDGMKKL